ncbi:MAG: hypothetical protein JWM09_1138 [Francisellaceae bacterium]|nr:hypothetical protein [Francisellaceae bacterium]
MPQLSHTHSENSIIKAPEAQDNNQQNLTDIRPPHTPLKALGPFDEVTNPVHFSFQRVSNSESNSDKLKNFDNNSPQNFTPRSQASASSKVTQIKESEQLTFQTAIDWLITAWKANQGEVSPEVQNWIQDNQELAHKFEMAGEDDEHIKDENLVEETYSGQELVGLKLNESLKTERFIQEVGSFAGEEIVRLKLGEKTKTDEQIAKGFQEIFQKLPEEIAGYFQEALNDDGIKSIIIILKSINKNEQIIKNLLLSPSPSKTPLFYQYNFMVKDISPRENLISEMIGMKEQVWTIKARLNNAQLPTEGKMKFVPDDIYNPDNPLINGINGGYMDKFCNEWIKIPSRMPGESFEWDVQLSEVGKIYLE